MADNNPTVGSVPLVPTVPLDKTLEAVAGFVKANTSDLLGAPADISHFVETVLSKNSTPAPPEYGSAYFRKLFFGPDAVETKSLTEVGGSLVSPGGVVGVGKAMIVGAIPKLAFEGISAKSGAKILTELDKLQTNEQAVNFFQATGLFKGAEGAAKAVISDAPATLNMSHFIDLPVKGGGNVTMLKVGTPDQLTGAYPSYKLRELLNHPELYKLYPELKDVKVMSHPGLPLGDAQFFPSQNKILLGGQKSPETAMASILHEIQHVIQDTEGFAAGSNPNVAREFSAIELTPARLENLRKLREEGNPHATKIADMLNADTRQAFQKYQAKPGEAEARFTESTMKLTQQEIEDRVINVIKNPLPVSFWDK